MDGDEESSPPTPETGTDRVPERGQSAGVRGDLGAPGGGTAKASGGEMLTLVPALIERIESGEWYGSAGLLARVLREWISPVLGPSSVPESPAAALEALRRSVPALRS